MARRESMTRIAEGTADVSLAKEPLMQGLSALGMVVPRMDWWSGGATSPILADRLATEDLSQHPARSYSGLADKPEEALTTEIDPSVRSGRAKKKPSPTASDYDPSGDER